MYAIWQACERFDVKPPGVVDCWDDCNVDTRSNLIAYSQIRNIEESENMEKSFG